MKFLLSFCILLVIFTVFPEIDIEFSKIFFNSEGGIFPYSTRYSKMMYVCDILIQLGSVAWIYSITIFIRKLYFPNLHLKGILNFSLKRKECMEYFRSLRRKLFEIGPRRKLTYVVLVAICGSFISVYSIKFYVQRVRPHSIHEFGGDFQFTRAWEHNRNNQGYNETFAFVSGHSAIGFLLYSIAFLYSAKSNSRRRWTIIGTIVGVSFGTLRVIQGEHFLSDIIFSGYVMYGNALLLSLIVKPDVLEKNSF